MWLTRVSIRNPVFATMVMIGLAVLGLFSYQRLKTEQMPEVALPFVLELTSYPGAAPVAQSPVGAPVPSAGAPVSPPPPDDDPDLRLQQDDAPGRSGAGPDPRA